MMKELNEITTILPGQGPQAPPCHSEPIRAKKSAASIAARACVMHPLHAALLTGPHCCS